MKKTVLALMALVTATGAAADERSEALLGALQRKMAGWGDYRVEFTVSIGDEAIAGSYEVSGGSYHLATPDIEIYCDGTTRYEVNLPDREVAIDRVDPADRTVMGDPTRLFDFLDGSYTHRYVGPAIVVGVNCERIELTGTTVTGAAGGGATQKIDVFLSTATGLPTRVDYTIGFMSTEAAVDVVRVMPNIAIDRAAFDFDAKRYPGFEIIDFR